MLVEPALDTAGESSTRRRQEAGVDVGRLRGAGVVDEGDASRGAGDLRPVVFAHEAERKVVHRAEGRGGRDPAVRHHQTLWAHPCRRVASCELVGEQPGGRGVAAVEESRLSQEERSDADGHDGDAIGLEATNRLDLGRQGRQRVGEVEALGELEARNDEDIGLADRGGADRETAGRRHPAAGRDDGDVVRRTPVGVGRDVRGHGQQVGNAEDLGREASRVGQDSDAQRTHARLFTRPGMLARLPSNMAIAPMAPAERAADDDRHDNAHDQGARSRPTSLNGCSTWMGSARRCTSAAKGPPSCCCPRCRGSAPT